MLILVLFIALHTSLFAQQPMPTVAAPCGLKLPAGSVAMPRLQKVLDAHPGTGKTLESGLFETATSIADLVALLTPQLPKIPLADFSPYKKAPPDDSVIQLLSAVLNRGWLDIPPQAPASLPDYLRGTATPPAGTLVSMRSISFLTTDSICTVILMSPHVSDAGDAFISNTLVQVRRAAPLTPANVMR
jgi:hypothetical protein